MSNLSWAETKRRVYERANGCCEYCRTSIANTGQSMHIGHINPHGGDGLENLCLACANCNLSKHAATSAIDPLTNETVPLFDPRSQNWQTHFAWNSSATHVIGMTAIGRSTVARLKMNRARMVLARERWTIAGFHPPDVD